MAAHHDKGCRGTKEGESQLPGACRSITEKETFEICLQGVIQPSLHFLVANNKMIQYSYHFHIIH